ncbi:hypothetical protein LCGC14_2405660, partial [marine sediment metagenome]
MLGIEDTADLVPASHAAELLVIGLCRIVLVFDQQGVMAGSGSQM